MQLCLRLFLLGLPFGGAAWYLRGVETLETRFSGFSSFCIVVAVVAAYLAAFAGTFRADPGPPAPRRRRDWWVGLAVALIFTWSAARWIEFFPASILSEAQEALRISQIAIDNCFEGKFSLFLNHYSQAYNLGLVPLVAPLVATFGPDPLVYKWANVAFFAVMLGLLAVLFARTNVPAGDRWTLLAMPLLASILPSLQMYRWHCVCLAGCLVLLRAAAAWREAIWRMAATLALFCGVFLLYHGQFMYVPALGVLAVWHLLSPERGVRDWKRAAVLIGGALLCTACFIAANRGLPFGRSNRAVQEASLMGILLQGDNLSIYASRVLRTPAQMFSWPAWGLVLLGTGATVARAQDHTVDRAALLLFGTGLTVNILCQAITNVSQHCWYLLPGLWLFLNGCAGLAGGLRECLGPRPAAALAAVALGFAGWRESRAYREFNMYHWTDSEPAQWNTADQLDYLFRHLSRLAVTTPATLHLIPGQGIDSRHGGFARDIPLTQLDWRRAAVEIRVYESEEELRRLIKGVREGRLRFSRLIVYLSQLGDNEEWNPTLIEPALAGLPFETSVLELQAAPLPLPMRCFALQFEAGR